MTEKSFGCHKAYINNDTLFSIYPNIKELRDLNQL